MRIPGLVALLVALSLAACSSEDERTAEIPDACFGSPADYRAALEAAPDAVRLDGSTAISDCIVSAQDGGSLASIGDILTEVAAELNEEAMRNPRSDAPVQLGYLVGAVAASAEQTGGIHADLVRRLESSARFVPAGGAPSRTFEQAYADGYAAGEFGG